MRRILFSLAVSGLIPTAALACTLCTAITRQSLRQDAQSAQNVYLGTMSNPRLSAVNAAGAANASATDFTVDSVVKATAARRGQKQITVPRYVPVDPKSPPKFLLFCDETNGQLDPYRGIPVKSATVVEYLKGALAIDPKDIAKILDFAGKHLDSTDSDVAGEAFLEFARANDAEVMAAAKNLPRDKIRRLLLDSQTPAERLGLLSYLLGACGNRDDAAVLSELLKNPGDRFRGAVGGLFAGNVMLDPAEGWKLIQTTLADRGRPFPERAAAMSALRFFYNADPLAVRPRAVTAFAAMLPQEDIADLAVGDLRHWKIWELSPQVVALYGQKSHDAPLMKQAILKYAIECPDAAAKAFVAEVRAANPKAVAEVEESLEFERTPVKPAGK